MEDKFKDFRNEKQEIDLISYALMIYGDDLSLAGIEYIQDIEGIQPIKSRQLAAVILVTAKSMS
ncbi:MAG: hypothetical protein K0U78_14905 [Actinomycetia bacterium]|nr:hypothetical protein [Actinomycetes bacterium]